MSVRDNQIKMAADILAGIVGPSGLTVRELGEALRYMCRRNQKATVCQEDGTAEAWDALARSAVQFMDVADTHRDLVN